MKFVSYDGNKIGVVNGEDVVELTDLVQADAGFWPPINMVQFIANFEALKPAIKARLLGDVRTPLSKVRLEAPIKWPNKLIAYPANYKKHIEEMSSSNQADKNGFFLKANSSISGPNDPIVLPSLDGREIHHECELAIIIGKTVRNISLEKAMDAVFGYSCLVDVVVRGNEERVMRKSWDTFCPIGPWIVTADEVSQPGALDARLTINGEVRQQANTRDLIYDIPHMIWRAASVATLYPGDIIATGTPEGVGPLADGDELVITIDQVGSMTIPIIQGA
ncbi:fumarylacetoacetate hydrolase protein (plasmid) [Rhizobium gallicum]|uniref:Fumarylacetoacetate hydrolase protein n=1 Tax=Rhizobium gallicum TaxID=56730 RepID=A0A1L5NS67_9HYPH|nr:fumarylacetoacetate hydrolase family protein [Rhizobium gallicum]APO70718.1 fumarylacetoacetate hydrolase protein [Rhizobium gallicum]